MRRLTITSTIYKTFLIPQSTFRSYTKCSNIQPVERDKVAIFPSLFSQQRRAYAPAAAAKECWNCQKNMGTGCDAIICKECGHIQDIRSDINFFELMETPQSFSLELEKLTKKFRQLQSVVHPDKFSNKTSREQTNSADWSSLINKAYKTLSVPIERGQYLLKFHGLEIPQENSVLEKEFLMEMMERNEQVDDANSKSELNKINDEIKKEISLKVNDLSAAFLENNLDTCKMIMVEMKYLMSIEKTIKKKLQSLM